MTLDRLRILHISPSYFTGRDIGGGERYSLELTKALSKYADTTLLVFDGERKTIHMKELRIEIYPKWRFGKFLKIDPISSSFFREFKEINIIHIHQFRKVISNISIALGKLKGIPVVVTDHGGGDPFSIYLFSLLVGYLVSGFLVVSKFSGKNFLRYSRPVIPIYGGVDISLFYPRKISKKENKILFVGRFLPHKGCEYLVKAVQDLDVELHMVGKPVNLGVIHRIKVLDKKKKVKFKFCLPDQDLPVEYSSALVTVLPSVHKDYCGKFHPIPELLGLTLLESMACETPVICSRVGGMPEIVSDGKSGFLVNPNDPLAIRDKIEYFVNNPKEAKKMGRFGKKIVLENFTWDAVAKRCLNAYRKFL